MSEETQQVEFLELEIESLLNFFIGLTSTKALQYMGLPVLPEKETEKDLNRARTCIDITSFLVEKLQPYTEEEELKQLKQVLSNLQFAYLRESN